MSEYFEYHYPDEHKSGYVQTVTAKGGSCMRITRWCYEHGAKTVEDKFDEHTKIVLDAGYIDFYDEELYTMFKLRWG